MLSYSRRFAVLLFLPVLLCSLAQAQRKPLQHSVYDSWKSIVGTKLSNDGKWIAYAINPQEGDGILEVQATGGDKKFSIERGASFEFSSDSHFLVATQIPKFQDVPEAKKKKTKPEDMPKNTLKILNLQTGDQTSIDQVTSFTLPKEDSGWMAYRPEPPKPEAPKDDKKPAEPSKDAKKPAKKADDKPGSALVIRNLATGKETRVESVVNWTFSKDGTVLAYSLSTKDGSGDGVAWRDLGQDRQVNVLQGMGRYPKLALSDGDKKLAFITDKDDYKANKPSSTLYLFDPKTAKCDLIAKPGTAGIPKDWWIHNDALSFSKSGRRIIFTTFPKPEEEKTDDTPDDEKVSVDIWSWTDPQIMPQQLLGAERERNRSYQAVYNVEDKQVVQLGTPDMPDVSIGHKGDSDIALGSSGLPYQKLASWEGDYQDYYVVNANSGQAKQILAKSAAEVSLSPDCKYLLIYNPEDRTFSTIDTHSLGVSKIATDIKVPLYNELNDLPDDPRPYGTGGWTEHDSRLLIYDNYDIWSVDPLGKSASQCITGGAGRNRTISFNYVRLDPEEEFVPHGPLLLHAFNRDSKEAGYFRLPVDSTIPEKLVYEPKFFSNPVKAKNADVVALQQEDFDEFRNLWLTDDNFANRRKITDANSQQKDYNWGTAELVRWISDDGIPLKGVLIKPQDFDYAKKYPMVVYYYERESDNLHRYYSPAPSASTINPSYFASNGYVVFIPDVAYRVGYPGESAMHCIVPGVLNILQKGFVDPKRVGLQGQSWGGYETAYMVTQTDLFACACAGAPVSDMISAYGGIRWGSGVSREPQYEHGQSRIGGTLWDKPLRYIENSPIYYADKIDTPLLMMNNDKDGAVPWYQGIELFSALRRLGKPAWLVVYNGEDHNLVQRKNRKDWSVRMQEFFDHYLQGAPKPVWMSKGVPATLKGRTMGFELEKGKTEH
jgi:dipeptidyl aminopeptidase/acylaminoacyl peptidase